MRRVERNWAEWEPGDRPKVGDFQIIDHPLPADDMIGEATVKMIHMVLPGDSICTIPIRPVPEAAKNINNGHSWKWDGNQDKPTLEPSVHHVGRWHGFIRKGRMESCK